MAIPPLPYQLGDLNSGSTKRYLDELRRESVNVSGSNIGTDGVGIYDSVSSNVLSFRKLVSPDDTLSITFNAVDHTVELFVDTTILVVSHSALSNLISSDDHTQYAQRDPHPAHRLPDPARRGLEYRLHPDAGCTGRG